jgi:hypothetical protein
MTGYFVPGIVYRRDAKCQQLHVLSSFLSLLIIHGVQRAFELCGFLLNQVKVYNGCF